MATSTESGLLGRQTRPHDASVERGGSPAVAARLRAMVRDTLADFPWPVRFSDWTDESVESRGTEAHWRGRPLEIRDPRAGDRILAAIKAI